MSIEQGNNFAKKHKGSIKLDPSIKEAVLKRSKEEKLPCAVAFEIVKDLGVEAAEVGKMTISSIAEAMKIKIKPCQIGAF